MEDHWRGNVKNIHTAQDVKFLLKLKLILFVLLHHNNTVCVVITGEYRTDSEVDSPWVKASVAEGSALPWKIGHLGASWRTSLPCCATTTKVPTGFMPPPARSHWTKAGQMVPLPTCEQCCALPTVHVPCPIIQLWNEFEVTITWGKKVFLWWERCRKSSSEQRVCWNINWPYYVLCLLMWAAVR